MKSQALSFGSSHRFARSWLAGGLAVSGPIVLAMSLAWAGDDFPPPYNSPSEKHLAPWSAERAAAAMRLPPGFRAQVFASEPMVQNPIAMTWDQKGRLWVAENFTYGDRTQKFDWSLRDRVLILEDTDGDGRADKRQVFTDRVQILTGLEVGRGGVWLMCPPRLLFVPDANADGVPDGPTQTILDGFDVGPSSHHNFANGLKWGPDGWLYGRCGHSCPGKIGIPGCAPTERIPMQGGIWRYHVQRKIFEVLCHGTVNPWGHDWDETGELFFINTVIGHLWHMMPGAHFKESSGESPNPAVFERMDMIADHHHFDTRGSWTESRDGKANDLGGGHAHSGVLIYQGTVWPREYRGQLFTLNLHGQRANRETLVRQGCGYVGKHNPDFLISADPFFRGLDLNTGPDGQVYLLDWSDTGECHESTGVHRTSGRIYRIVAPAGKPEPAEPMRFAKPACLAGPGTLPSLWNDYSNGQVSRARLLELLRHPDEHVRVWAIRLLTDLWPLDTLLGPSPHRLPPDDPEVRSLLLKLAKTDSSGLVGLALASTLQRLRVEHRAELAAPLMQRAEWVNDRDFPFLIWYGIYPILERDPNSFLDLLERTPNRRWVLWASRWIATQGDAKRTALEALFGAAAAWPQEKQEAVLLGLGRGFRGWRQVAPPKDWDRLANGAAAKKQPALVEELQRVFGRGRPVEELATIALDPKADLAGRQKALESLIEVQGIKARKVCEQLLEARGLNLIAARGLAVVDDPEVARKLCRQYRRFAAADRPALLEILVSRPSFARVLIEELAGKTPPIPLGDLGAVHARQIRNLGDRELAEAWAKVWGQSRESNADKRALIQKWKETLKPETLSQANPRQGRAVFEMQCATCHVLFGSGQKVGPDLTGAQRGSLDYLLENILDPGATLSRDYRASVIQLKDGRVLTGLITAQDGQTVTLRTSTESRTLRRADIEEIRQTDQSPMPDGLLQNLTETQAADLFSYLMHPHQVPPPEPPKK